MQRAMRVLVSPVRIGLATLGVFLPYNSSFTQTETAHLRYLRTILFIGLEHRHLPMTCTDHERSKYPTVWNIFVNGFRLQLRI